jgi:hypothetical protein
MLTLVADAGDAAKAEPPSTAKSSVDRRKRFISISHRLLMVAAI